MLTLCIYVHSSVIGLKFCVLWYTETFALGIELASGSDVTGSARWRIRFMVTHG